MSETDTRSWSELLPDLISIISNKVLDPIDLLAFRGTCRRWRQASANAAAKLQKSLLQQTPWLLRQESGNKEECIVHNFSTKGKYNMNLPELVGSNILGSFQGWLLLFNSQLGGKVFFFCPFSRQKMYLPNLPQSQICSNSLAVCNSSPTSISDRTICVITHECEWISVIYILRPGAQAWDEVTYDNMFEIEHVTGALQEDQNLILFNHKDKTQLVMINIDENIGEIIDENIHENIDENNILDTIINQGVVIHLNEEASNNFSCSVQKLLRRVFEAIENCLESKDIVKETFSMDDLSCAYVFGTCWRDCHGKELMLFKESYIKESHDSELMLLWLFNNLNIEEHNDQKLNDPIATLDFMQRQRHRGIWLHPRLFSRP